MPDLFDVTLLRPATASFRYDFKQERISETYRIQLAKPSRDFPAILLDAQRPHWTDPVPLRGQLYPHTSIYAIYAETFEMSILDANQHFIDCEVNYTSLEPGEQDRDEKDDNPLNWPPEFSIDWVEEEVPITHAYNVQTLGPTGQRPPSFGPVVNGALREFDEPLMRTTRYAVVRIKYNVAQLETAININELYQGTTNNSVLVLFSGTTIGERQAEFLVAETSGRQKVNDIEYYEMTISIAVRRTTDRIINNVGWVAWDWAANNNNGDFVNIKVADAATGNQELPSEPQFLNLDGTKAAPGVTPTVTYRYLEGVDYSPLLP